jgi:hypothetical protein
MSLPHLSLSDQIVINCVGLLISGPEVWADEGAARRILEQLRLHLPAVTESRPDMHRLAVAARAVWGGRFKNTEFPEARRAWQAIQLARLDAAAAHAATARAPA